MATATTTKSASSNGSGESPTEGIQKLIEGAGESEKSALEAVQRFVQSVNDAVPDIGDEGPRHQIIDAAFRMTQQIFDAVQQVGGQPRGGHG
ncbi:MAG: hypothetical protein V9E94_00290 [Microthrixaceae bacterium]